MKTAIAATGIGLLVVGIGELMSALSAYTSAAEKAAEAQKELNKSIQDGANAQLEGEENYIDRQSRIDVAEAKAKGKSAREIFEIEESWRKQKIESLQRHRLEIINIDSKAAYEDEKNIKKIAADNKVARFELEAQENKDKADKEKAKTEKAAEAAKQRNEKLKELEKSRAAAELEAAKKLVDLRNQIYIKGIEDENKAKKIAISQQLFKESAEINANEKLKEETKQALIIELRKKAQLEIDEIDKQEAKDKQKKEEEFQKELEKVKLEIRLAGIKDEYEKSKAQIESNYQLQYKDIDKNETYTAEQKLALKLALQQKENQELDALKLNADKKKAADDIAELDKQISKSASDLELQKTLLDQKDILLEQSYKKGLILEKAYTDGVEANAKARVDIAQKEADAKAQLLQMISQALAQASDIVGKETGTGKTLAVASALINTYQGISKGVALGFPLAIPAVAMAAMTGFSAVKNILAVKVPAGGGTGGGSTPAMPNVTTSAPMTPAAPTAQTTNISQQSINQLGNQAVKAYVIESDVTSNQQRIEAIRQRARFS